MMMFCIYNDGFCIKNDEIYIKNDEISIKKFEICIKMKEQEMLAGRVDSKYKFFNI